MRWQLVNEFLADDQGRRVEEGQTLEFKESLSTSCEREGIRSLVAFANSSGGTVLFGVRKDGFVEGVQSGQDTLETLGGKVTQHTYPSLPPSIDRLEIDGKPVVVAEVPGDTPPVIGVYLLSEKPIAPEKPVEASNLQAFRRVGRRDQKEDFMRLRTAQAADPRLRLGPPSVTRSSDKINLHGLVWVEGESGTAQNIKIHLEPLTAGASPVIADLPRAYGRTEQDAGVVHLPFPPTRYYLGAGDSYSFWIEQMPDTLPNQLTVSAAYMDDWGVIWEARRVLDVITLESGRFTVADRGEFRRRILRFPPKAESL